MREENEPINMIALADAQEQLFTSYNEESRKPAIWHISIESWIRYLSDNDNYGLLHVGRRAWP